MKLKRLVPLLERDPFLTSKDSCVICVGRGLNGTFQEESLAASEFEEEQEGKSRPQGVTC